MWESAVSGSQVSFTVCVKAQLTPAQLSPRVITGCA